MPGNDPPGIFDLADFLFVTAGDFLDEQLRQQLLVFLESLLQFLRGLFFKFVGFSALDVHL